MASISNIKCKLDAEDMVFSTFSGVIGCMIYRCRLLAKRRPLRRTNSGKTETEDYQSATSFLPTTAGRARG